MLEYIIQRCCMDVFLQFVILPSSLTSADPLPVKQSEVQGTSGIIEDSAQEDTASVVDLSKCYRLGQMKSVYTH